MIYYTFAKAPLQKHVKTAVALGDFLVDKQHDRRKPFA
jgi:hypothetical protein